MSEKQTLEIIKVLNDYICSNQERPESSAVALTAKKLNIKYEDAIDAISKSFNPKNVKFKE